MKKSIFKRWWFWVIVGVVVLSVGIASAGGNDKADKEPTTELFAETPIMDRSMPDEEPTELPEPSEVIQPTQEPSEKPMPSAEPSPSEEPMPTAYVETSAPEPTTAPTSAPTAEPTPEPTPVPTPEPTPDPTPEPTPEPTPATVTVAVHGAGRNVTLPSGTLVWIPASGSKFHNKNNCGNMNPEKARQITVDQALMNGYEACEKCY